MAIFGLIVIVLSIYIPLQKLEPLEKNAIQLSTMYGPLLEVAKEADRDASRELDCAIYEASNEKTPEIASYKKSCELVYRTKQEAAATRKTFTEVLEKTKALEIEQAFLSGQYRLYRNLGIFTGLIGILLCVLGFWLWYVRLQRYLDISAQKNA
jgi:hypothetical protein